MDMTGPAQRKRFSRSASRSVVSRMVSGVVLAILYPSLQGRTVNDPRVRLLPILLKIASVRSTDIPFNVPLSR